MGKLTASKQTRRFWTFWVALAVLVCVAAKSTRAQTAATDTRAVPTVGVSGGLCVQLGSDDLAPAEALAKTGRFLVQVLEPDRASLQIARQKLNRQGIYGLVSVDEWRVVDKLPYTENLVNLIVMADTAAAVSLEELWRVLCPNGVVLAGTDRATAEAWRRAGFEDLRRIRWAESHRTWFAARKPWPQGMDEWTHPRHSASGNPVSNDMLVGPPRRVRWVAHASAEVRGLVSAGGRNFYAGVLARDAFNGLRLWNTDLISPSAPEPFVMKNLPNGTPMPVATEQFVFAVTQGTLVALDAATGRRVREYTTSTPAREILVHDGLVIAAGVDGTRAFDAQSADLVWTYPTAEPRQMVAGDTSVVLIEGSTKRGEKAALVTLEQATGRLRWKRDDLPWLTKVRRLVYSRGLIACEVSSFNNDAPGNALYVLSASDGQLAWKKEYPPGMNHIRQARAMFIGEKLWILHGGRLDQDTKLPIQGIALDPKTGAAETQLASGLAHCFPPVATPRYLLAGEMNFTDLTTGNIDANHITKAACGRDYGWMPANGLVYVTSKHCVCWPMLRGYAALAADRPDGDVGQMKLTANSFRAERGTASAESSDPNAAIDWPMYRHDPWRSASTTAALPTELKTLWSIDLGAPRHEGPIVADWRENPFVKGPVTAPVIAKGRVVVARPDVHEVVCVDANQGTPLWRFTANGRVDTAPTLHDGLCLFGTKTGWVYCLRADNGRLVWRLRAAPVEERMVAYGQVESPWPVSGSVLVMNDTAYFAAGRQSLADGGILVFAVQPRTGSVRWVRRLNTVPQQGFYESSALEFDNFDLLYREQGRVAMARWSFDPQDGAMSCDRWNAYARQNTGGGLALVPRASWSYAPRHQRRIKSYTPLRPLVAFRDSMLVGCLQGAQTLFRRDFKLEDGEEIETTWMTGWAAGGMEREGKHMPWPTNRLAEKATWTTEAFEKARKTTTVDALLLADDKFVLVGSDGTLQVRTTADGSILASQSVPAPLWDGLAAAQNRLYLTTADGKLLCLGSL